MLQSEGICRKLCRRTQQLLTHGKRLMNPEIKGEIQLSCVMRHLPPSPPHSISYPSINL